MELRKSWQPNAGFSRAMTGLEKFFTLKAQSE
jgi:hypothetical protein